MVALVLLVHLALAAGALAGTLTWDPNGSTAPNPSDGAGNWDTTSLLWWNGASNVAWDNATPASAVFGAGSGAAGTVSVGSGINVANLTFNAPVSGTYILSGNTLTLSGNPTITTATGTSNQIGSYLAGTAFTKEGGGILALNPGGNNTYSGTTFVNNGILHVGGNDTRIYVNGDLVVNPAGTFRLTSGGAAGGVIPWTATLIVNGGNVLGNASGKYLYFNKLVLDNNGSISVPNPPPGNFYFNPTNTDARSGTIYANLYRSITNNLFKATAGTVIVSNRPNTAASDGYLVTMNAGTLIFDKSSQNANRLLNNGLLTLGGGSLVFSNGNTGINPTAENPGTAGTTINPGASSVLGTNVSASGGNITFGAFARKAGGTFDFQKVGAGSMTTTSANNNGILGGWATWFGTDWLVGTTLAAYSAYTTSSDPTTWLAANNVSLAANPSANLDDTTINSLRLTAAATVTLNAGKTLTLASGGLLVTGSGATAITGGTLKGASGSDLVIIQNSSADLTVNSALADNGTASSLTKSGSGKLVLAPASNGMTGSNYLNGGAVEVSDLSLLASGPLVMNAGTLRYTGSSVSSTRAVTCNGLGGTFDVSSAGTTVTQSGVITGSGAAIGDLGGLTKTGPGTLALTASNYFNGPTVVNEGTLLINGTNAYNTATWGAGNVAVYGGTLGGTGLLAGNVAIKANGTVSPGASLGTLTLGANLTCESGSTNLFEVTNSPGGCDLLVIQGNLALSNNVTIALKVLGTPLSPGTNTLIQYSGTKSGSFNPTLAVVGETIDGSPSIDEGTPGRIKLVVVPQVAITSQPADTIVSTNAPATFNVSATGTAPITYQWYYYGDQPTNSPTPLTDATNASFTISSAQATNSGFYRVVVANSYNSVTSRLATLIVGNVLPVLAGPANQTVIAGNNVTFSTSVVIANPQPTFQWQTNDVDVAGAMTSSLTLNNVPYALDGAKVSVIASNIAGMATNTATLTVIVTPVITPAPTNLVVNVGDSAIFYSGATGVPMPLLQWYKDGVALVGETGGTLTITSAQGSNIGNYSLVASNVAGVATSPTARLTVLSTTLATTTLAPSNGATGVCYDTPLCITFNSAVSTVTNGRVLIYNVTNSATPVDTLDMSLNNARGVQSRGLFPGDSQAFNYYPVMISGSTAAIYPHPGVLSSNQTYYVTLEAGVVADNAGAYFGGISATNTWQFTTKPTGPSNATNLVVAADGSGDFVTVQGAVDSIPLNNTAYTLINIRDGNYVGLVNISSKHNLTFRGQSRTGTVVSYPNNANIAPNGTTHARMSFKVNANDIAIENLTLLNSTPQGGSQAEALMIEGNSAATAARRCIVNNADIVSRQDTILANINASQGYFYDTTVRGNFDYIWGGGNLFFAKCTIHTLTNTGSSSYNLTAARTDYGTTSATGNWQTPDGTKWSSNGISFVECTLEADSGVGNITLAGNNGTAGGLVSWALCKIDTNAYVAPASSLWTTYNFWQYSNTDLLGNPISFPGLVTLTNGDPRLLAATNATIWFYGWTPKLAPNILTNPANQSVAGGGTISLNVAATGIPAPAYQWLRNGTPLDGQTNATLTIANAHAGQAGTYSVIVSNVAGVVTSGNATVYRRQHGPDPGCYRRSNGQRRRHRQHRCRRSRGRSGRATTDADL